MKTSKKIVALVLAMVMIFALTASALAATNAAEGVTVMASSAAVWTKVIENGVGLATFSLSVTPEGNESFQESNFLLSTGQTLKNFLHDIRILSQRVQRL